MTHEQVVAVLGYAAGHELAVRIVTADGTAVVGIPTTVDAGITASEVYLHPAGDDDTEIAIRLAAVTAVELLEGER